MGLDEEVWWHSGGLNSDFCPVSPRAVINASQLELLRDSTSLCLTIPKTLEINLILSMKGSHIRVFAYATANSGGTLGHTETEWS